MGFGIARILPPIAVAVVIVTLDFGRHVWWSPLDTWPTFLLAVAIASVGTYAAGEFLLRFFTRRYSTSIRIAADIASLPSTLERISERSLPAQQGMDRQSALKRELLRNLADLAGGEGAAFYAVEAGSSQARLDATFGIPDGDLPQSVPCHGSGEYLAATEISSESLAALEPALHQVGFASVEVLPLLSGGQPVGCLVLGGHRRLQEWLRWREANELVIALVGGMFKNLQLASESEAVATLRERDRIARELHDSLAQTLTYIQMESRAGVGATASDGNGTPSQRLTTIAEAAADGLKEIRTAILDLRGGTAKGQGFLELLEQYVWRFGKTTGMSAEVVVEPGATTRFPPLVEIQLLRVVQEALTNVRKHALTARQVKVEFCNQSGFACVCIRDDGVGFEPAQVLQQGRGFGLVSMRERLQDLGGDLRIDSSPGVGTHIQARVPLSRISTERWESAKDAHHGRG